MLGAPLMKTLRHACALGTVLLVSMFLFGSTSFGAQSLRDGAYGLTAEQVAKDEWPTGWVPLQNSGGPQWAASLDPKDQPCSMPAQQKSVLQNRPWPAGVVPFEFDSNVSGSNKFAAVAAMFVIESVANVTFVARIGEPDYLHIQEDSVNQATQIGFAGGQTTIKVVSWNTQGRIVHEFLHALGFHHEQARTDRETFVDYFDDNVIPFKEGNFSIKLTSDSLGPYDFGSIMQYGTCYFAICCVNVPSCVCNGCETLLPTPMYAAFEPLMGQRAALSPLDVHGLRSFYPESNWRFVDASNSSAGDGSGLNPWRDINSAMTQAPIGARVFVMPGTYVAKGTWSEEISFEAPIGGVLMQ